MEQEMSYSGLGICWQGEPQTARGGAYDQLAEPTTARQTSGDTVRTRQSLTHSVAVDEYSWSSSVHGPDSTWTARYPQSILVNDAQTRSHSSQGVLTSSADLYSSRQTAQDRLARSLSPPHGHSADRSLSAHLGLDRHRPSLVLRQFSTQSSDWSVSSDFWSSDDGEQTLLERNDSEADDCDWTDSESGIEGFYLDPLERLAIMQDCTSPQSYSSSLSSATSTSLGSRAPPSQQNCASSGRQTSSQLTAQVRSQSQSTTTDDDAGFVQPMAINARSYFQDDGSHQLTSQPTTQHRAKKQTHLKDAQHVPEGPSDDDRTSGSAAGGAYLQDDLSQLSPQTIESASLPTSPDQQNGGYPAQMQQSPQSNMSAFPPYYRGEAHVSSMHGLLLQGLNQQLSSPMYRPSHNDSQHVGEYNDPPLSQERFMPPPMPMRPMPPSYASFPPGMPMDYRNSMDMTPMMPYNGQFRAMSSAYTPMPSAMHSRAPSYGSGMPFPPPSQSMPPPAPPLSRSVSMYDLRSYSNTGEQMHSSSMAPWPVASLQPHESTFKREETDYMFALRTAAPAKNTRRQYDLMRNGMGSSSMGMTAHPMYTNGSPFDRYPTEPHYADAEEDQISISRSSQGTSRSRSVSKSFTMPDADTLRGMPTKRSRGRRPPLSPDLGIAVGIEDPNASPTLQQIQYVGLTKTGRPRKIFMCKVPDCNKCFKRSEHLKRHIRSIHTSEKPYECEWPGCSKSFSRQDNRAQHMRVHRNEPRNRYKSSSRRNSEDISLSSSELSEVD
ncbi:uncharacterized protein L969DRAFT_496319 [Mixia osmundae IAM 14324]|uniref:uncharacterized protein n=1 Tax=Mixia osmundae (strain CBS 9802 / IAM 14324 / JCM 22182 / KY 12970) TaxID=764103 RepID=UPI0004A548E4|nr:uncharacterized protein L969DRAFT_496319 [Mixia osmundae IAM 14324]KEI38897.1 hypothetical protein L969DRAFT_496319 [Mixia osmundae IAM 14324]